MKLGGIDYGSKLAGTTVLAWWADKNEEVKIFSTRKNQDADIFLKKTLKELCPKITMMDAPLSLPRAYTTTDTSPKDFFYRQCDRSLKAMSPMFLGGLTARAMQIKHELKETLLILETYPAALAKEWELQQVGYKQSQEMIPIVAKEIMRRSPLRFEESSVLNWHVVDAILALCSAWRFSQRLAQAYGGESEGLIWV